MGRVRKLVLREYIERDGGYWQYWYGAVPPEGTRYRVLDEAWGREPACPDLVRYIYDWELARGTESGSRQGPG
jgi:hypothetical protein